VQLPHASSTKIIPNLGAGGLRLGQKLFPLPQGWRHPNKCENLRGFGVCTWTSHPEPRMGPKHPATGPLVYVASYRDRIVRIEIADYDVNPGHSTLARWRTSRGIAIGSAVSAVVAAYGPGGAGTGPRIYTMWGAGGSTQTDFGARNGVVDDIEINACSSVNPC
jgi:hypothetical protein